MYRYALRPRWILSHAFAVFVVVSFVSLGFWQLRRHDERALRNAAVQARASQEVVPVEELDLDGTGLESLRFRPVQATGSYLEGADVLVDNRSEGGLPGVWVVTPMRLGSGAIVAVSRGFQGFEAGELPDRQTASGTVEVIGTVLPWDRRDCGTRVADDGSSGMACLRRDVVEDAAGGAVLPVLVQLVRSDPQDDPHLRAVPLPELTSGPHRSYAVQWFIFATIVAVVYVLILRRVARDRAGDPEP